MANPVPYFISSSSIAYRLMMTFLQRLVTQSCLMLGRMQVVMGTASGMALTYTAYRSLTQGDSSSLLKRAECRRKKGKRGRGRKKSAIPEEEKPPRHGLLPRPEDAVYLDLAASARCQPSVSSHDRAHALFLWIQVKKEADPRDVACSVARIQQYVEEVEAPTENACGDFRILAGVGFGPEFYKQVNGKTPQGLSNAKHSLISSSSVGGDILVHAKSNDQDLLRQLSKVVLGNLPKNTVFCHEETYAKTRYPDVPSRAEAGENEPSIINYQYTQGDIELFPPKHPVSEDKPWLLFVSDTGSKDTEFKREETATDCRTGGSYVMTQRWVHDNQLLNCNGDLVMNQWVDRAWEQCAGPPGERKFRSPSMLKAELADISMEHWIKEAYKECLDMQKNHPERQIECTAGVPVPKMPFRILRQSLPYKNKGGEAGLFFISYASSPRYNELLLDRLVNSACGSAKLNSASQNVFCLSRNVRSACWYFPGMQELRELE